MKQRAICLTAAAVLAISLSGCGGDSSVSAPEAPAQTSAAETTAAPVQSDVTESAAAATDAAPAATDAAPAEGGAVTFDYVLNGVTLPCGTEADALIASLGTPDNTFEAPSCAFTGVSYYYTYGGVQVVTYPDEFDQSLNRIYEVDLVDDTAATNEGIRIGDTYDAMVAACGKPDRETAAYAMYEAEGKALQFFFEGNNITDIVYTVVLN